ncbi:MAG TPA: SpoIIIAH-like family protein [Candidatus Choladousia intestinipullorum]|nr:SpoIIIAH-like family protein [Candidatus Choladousia intestinipullorum]
MKRIFKKNQIIITTLAIMIAIAGYLNYSGKILDEEADTVSTDDSTVLLTDDVPADNTYTDTYSDIVSLDGDGTEEASLESESTAEAAVGEAVLANGTASDSVLAAARLNREQVRAKNKETLLEVINNTNVTEDQKQNAVSAMTQMTQLAEQEAAAELLLEAKGFEDCIVSIADGSVDVVVNQSELSDAERAQIEDIVKRKTEISGENIVITPKDSVSAETEAPAEQ